MKNLFDRLCIWYLSKRGFAVVDDTELQSLENTATRKLKKNLRLDYFGRERIQRFGTPYRCRLLDPSCFDKWWTS